MPTRIHAPEGAIGREPHALASSPDVLSGLRVAVLDNGKPGADTLLGFVAAELAERTGASAVGIQRKGSAATPCEDALLGELVEGAELVVTGTAD